MLSSRLRSSSSSSAGSPPRARLSDFIYRIPSPAHTPFQQVATHRLRRRNGRWRTSLALGQRMLHSRWSVVFLILFLFLQTHQRAPRQVDQVHAMFPEMPPYVTCSFFFSRQRTLADPRTLCTNPLLGTTSAMT